MKIWERHLSKRLFGTLLFILISLFCVYILIDLSIHSVRFFSGKAGLGALFLYYTLSFSQYLNLFSALALLLTLLKVLTDVSHHLEHIALHMAGISLKKLTSPLFALALFLGALSIANAQWVSPYAHESIGAFRNKHAKKNRSELRAHAHTVSLEDGSELIYQTFDPHNKTLFDLFWLRSQGEIWHIKSLTTQGVGSYIDKFQRNEEKQLMLKESHESLFIETLRFSEEEVLQKFIPFDCRPLFSLFAQSFRKSADAAAIESHLHYKLAFSLLPILIVLFLTPHLLRFSRTKRLFLIASLSLFCLISFITILDGMLILAENRVFPPTLAIWIPWLLSILLALFQWPRQNKRAR